MDELFMSLTEKMYNIKDKIQDNEYLEIMNTIKDLYNSLHQCNCENCIILSEDDSDDESSQEDSDYETSDYESTDYETSEDDETVISCEIDYESDIVYAKMFEEYTCNCNTEVYECLCSSSFNLFRYCKNYQKIVDACPNLKYIMNLHFPDINSEYTIVFSREINIDNSVYSRSDFCKINTILIQLISISGNYTRKHLILILCNFVMQHFYHVIHYSELKFCLYDKINEILAHDYHNSIDTYTDILIESGETTELIHYWLSISKPFIER